MPGALASQLEVRDQRRSEEHHGLCRERSVLGGTEGQHVHPGSPGDLPGMAAKERQRIGEACSVHVHLEPMFVRHRGELCELRGRITGAKLGGLGNGQHGRLHCVNVDASRAERSAERGRRDAAVLARQHRELRPTGEEPRRPALVGDDMRLLVAVNRAVGRTERGDAQRVGGGACGHRKHTHRRTEELTEAAIEAFGPLILPVSVGQTVVGLAQGGEYFRTGAAGVVAQESQGTAPLSVGRFSRCASGMTRRRSSGTRAR